MHTSYLPRNRSIHDSIVAKLVLQECEKNVASFSTHPSSSQLGKRIVTLSLARVFMRRDNFIFVWIRRHVPWDHFPRGKGSGSARGWRNVDTPFPTLSHRAKKRQVSDDSFLPVELFVRRETLFRVPKACTERGHGKGARSLGSRGPCFIL